MLKRVVESKHPCPTPTVAWSQSPILKKDCTSGHVIEVFKDSDKVGTAVVFLHS